MEGAFSIFFADCNTKYFDWMQIIGSSSTWISTAVGSNQLADSIYHFISIVWLYITDIFMADISKLISQTVSAMHILLSCT